MNIYSYTNVSTCTPGRKEKKAVRVFGTDCQPSLIYDRVCSAKKWLTIYYAITHILLMVFASRPTFVPYILFNM